MKRHAFLALPLATALAACSQLLPLSGVSGATSGARPAVGQTGGLASRTNATGAAPASADGSLEITVRWPQQPSYRTQLLPTSTTWLGATVTDASGSMLVPEAWVQRQAGQTTATLDVGGLPPGNNYSLSIQAYRDVNQPTSSSTVIAQGTANVNIWPSHMSAVPITLAPTEVPTISSLSTDLASPSTTITIAGANLAPVNGVGPTVLFDAATASVNGQIVYTSAVTASDVTSTDASGDLLVQIPSGVVSGQLVVENDGVQSSGSNFVLWICPQVTLVAPTTWQNFPMQGGGAPGTVFPSPLGNTVMASGLSGPNVLSGTSTFTNAFSATESIVLPSAYGTVSWPYQPAMGGPNGSTSSNPPWLTVNGLNLSILDLGTPPSPTITSSNPQAGFDPAAGSATGSVTTASATTSVTAQVGAIQSAPYTVTVDGPVTGVTLNMTTATMSASAQTQVNLTATVSGTDPLNDGVNWSTLPGGSSPLIAAFGTVATNSITIVPASTTTGTADVYATSVDNPNVSATVSITIGP